MTLDKLLVYSDGGKSRYPYASYAAYMVNRFVNWRTDYEAHKELACLTLHTPLVHVCRQKVYPKRANNTVAEAVALRMAVNWAGIWCREHDDVKSVEFCSDDQALIDGVKTNKTFSPGRVADEVRLLRENVKRNLSKVDLRWTWIPGEVMKQTVINH